MFLIGSFMGVQGSSSTGRSEFNVPSADGPPCTARYSPIYHHSLTPQLSRLTQYGCKQQREGMAGGYFALFCAIAALRGAGVGACGGQFLLSLRTQFDGGTLYCFD
jgi:hypothetical protein